MINAEFFKADGAVTGFKVSGHSGMADEGQDVLCAFVSSAVLMTANTVTEVYGVSADIKESDGFLELHVLQSAEKVQGVLKGLLLHLTELSKDYPQNIDVKITEV